jgi:hypothetical protein
MWFGGHAQRARGGVHGVHCLRTRSSLRPSLHWSTRDVIRPRTTCWWLGGMLRATTNVRRERAKTSVSCGRTPAMSDTSFRPSPLSHLPK